MTGAGLWAIISGILIDMDMQEVCQLEGRSGWRWPGENEGLGRAGIERIEAWRRLWMGIDGMGWIGWRDWMDWKMGIEIEG